MAQFQFDNTVAHVGPHTCLQLNSCIGPQQPLNQTLCFRPHNIYNMHLTHFIRSHILSHELVGLLPGLQLAQGGLLLFIIIVLLLCGSCFVATYPPLLIQEWLCRKEGGGVR